MKLKSLFISVPIVLGIVLFLLLSVNIDAVSLDNYVTGYSYGQSSRQEASGNGLYFMDGSTTVGITLRESDQRNWNILDSIWYETASDVWRQPTADVTLKDSDGNGYKIGRAHV